MHDATENFEYAYISLSQCNLSIVQILEHKV